MSSIGIRRRIKRRERVVRIRMKIGESCTIILDSKLAHFNENSCMYIA